MPGSEGARLSVDVRLSLSYNFIIPSPLTSLSTILPFYSSPSSCCRRILLFAYTGPSLLSNCERSEQSILLIALGFGAFPMVLRHCLCSLPKLPLREVFLMSRSHQFLSVPDHFFAQCHICSSASAKPVLVVGPHLFTQSS